MKKAPPKDAFAQAAIWNIAEAAGFLGERGEQFVDWAWKNGVISLYGMPVGESAPVEIIFNREHGKIDFAGSRVMLGMMCVTHEHVTIRWGDVKRLAQFEVDLLLKEPGRWKEEPEKDLLTDRERETARESGAAAVQAKSTRDLIEGEASEEEVSPASDMRLGSSVNDEDDSLFRKYMNTYHDKDRAREALFRRLMANGVWKKTAGNRASSAKNRFEQSSFPTIGKKSGKTIGKL